MAYFAGLLTPPLLVVLLYAAVGELHALIYWTITYNRAVYMSPFPAEVIARTTEKLFRNHLALFGAVVPIAVGAVVLPLFRARSLREVFANWDADPFVPTTALSAAAGLIGAHAAMRGFGHYYVQVVPWAGLLVGAMVEDALRRQCRRTSAGRFLAELTVLGMTAWLTWFGVDRVVRDYRRSRDSAGFQDPRNDSVCKLFQAYSKPEDHVFIWGFVPSFYTSCARKPASRFVYTTMVAGVVPWFTSATVEEDDLLAVPNSREQLIQDLEDTKPPIILDWGSSIGNRPMRRYAILARYLNTHYCLVQTVNAVDTYFRRPPNGRCPPRLTK